MALTKVQMHLLNFFKTVHVASEQKARDFYQALSDENSFANNLTHEISTINRLLKNYDLEIAQSVDEFTCEKSFVLVNTIHDELTSKAKFYEKNLLQFFAEIVKVCIESDCGCVTETNCLNLSSRIGLSKTVSQNALEILIRDKWLDSRVGLISLGIRSIVELQPKIKQLYRNEIKYCCLCQLFLIQGFTCGNCSAKYHFECLKRLKSKRAKVSCTKCGADFHDLPLQVLCVEEDEHQEHSKTHSSVSNKRQKVH